MSSREVLTFVSATLVARGTYRSGAILFGVGLVIVGYLFGTKERGDA